jgi:hypothetical protein
MIRDGPAENKGRPKTEILELRSRMTILIQPVGGATGSGMTIPCRKALKKGDMAWKDSLGG